MAQTNDDFEGQVQWIESVPADRGLIAAVVLLAREVRAVQQELVETRFARTPRL